jgi:hypothetical protein
MKGIAKYGSTVRHALINAQPRSPFPFAQLPISTITYCYIPSYDPLFFFSFDSFRAANAQLHVSVYIYNNVFLNHRMNSSSRAEPFEVGQIKRKRPASSAYLAVLGNICN